MSNNDYDQLVRSVYVDNFQQVNEILENQKKDYTKKTFQIQQDIYEKIRQQSVRGKIDIPTKGLTLMHVAAFCNSIETFKILKERGHKLDTPSDDSYLPIHYACFSNSQQIVEYILNNDPDEAKVLPPVKYHLIYLSIFVYNASILRLLIQHGADFHAAENLAYGPLTTAIKVGSLECLNVLLENGAKPREELKEGSFSVTMLAISNTMFDAVPALIEAGDDLSIYSGNETALSLACFLSYLPIVKFICDHLEQVDIDPSLQRKAAVHWACQSKDVEIVRTVLSKGINVNRLDEEGHTGLFFILDLTDEDATTQIIELLCAHGFDVNIESKWADGTPRNSVLGDFVSSIHRPVKVIDWLLDHGADPNAMLVSKNKTIIEFVKISRNRSLLTVFRKYVKL